MIPEGNSELQECRKSDRTGKCLGNIMDYSSSSSSPLVLFKIY